MNKESKTLETALFIAPLSLILPQKTKNPEPKKSPGCYFLF